MASAVRGQDDLEETLIALFSRTGYDGTALSAITAASGLGKGSLYHAFPGGKAAMGARVLNAEQTWFDTHVIAPLASPQNPPVRTIPAVLEALRDHVAGGERPCLHALFAQTDAAGQFAPRIRDFFADWQNSLHACLTRAGLKKSHAEALSTETLTVLLGGMTLARATSTPEMMDRAIDRQGARLLAAAGRSAS